MADCAGARRAYETPAEMAGCAFHSRMSARKRETGFRVVEAIECALLRARQVARTESSEGKNDQKRDE